MSAARERLGDDRVASVIVVTHNNRGLIGDCLRAIYGSASTHDLDVIVLDNNSSDGTTDVVVRGGWPVNVVALAENVGFARGVNRAREVARGRHLVLVNSDAFLDTGCIDALLARLEGDPGAGIVGARLRYPSGALHPAGGTFPSLLGGLWVALFLHRVPGLSRA